MSAPAYDVRSDLNTQLSEETIRMVQASYVRSGIDTSTGFTGYVLEAPSKVINPVITPLVNMLPRKQGKGIDVEHWKAVTSFDTGRSRGTLSGNSVPTAVTYSVANMSNTYQTIALSNSVTFGAQWTAQSQEGDLRARRVAELLYQLKMQEESWILTAASLAMVPPAPVVSVSATTGGHFLDSTTYYVCVTAVNAQGETTMSARTKITTAANSGGNTNVLSVTVFTVPDVSYYNVYAGTTNARTSLFKQTAISGLSNAPQPAYQASITLNGGGTAPSGEVQGPVVVLTHSGTVDSSGNPPATNTATNYVDTGSNSIMWDGLIAQGLLNTSTSNGLTLGAQVGQPAAATGLLALADLDSLLLSMYNQAAGDPDFLIVNPIVDGYITKLVINANQTRFVVEANQPERQGNLTAQYRVTHYLNKFTGKEIPIIPDRYCPADTAVFLPMSIPYPTPDVANAVQIMTNREYWGVDFAVTNSGYTFADYVMETLQVYFLGGLGVLRGILPAS